MYKSRDFVGFLQYINLDESHIDTLVKDFYVLEKAGLIEVFSNAVNSLEEKGYIIRCSLPTDKRQFSIHPTEKMLNILPEVKSASIEWMTLLSEGIPEEELEIFDSVLRRMEARAREIAEKAMKIAGDMCVYTNHNLTIEEV